MSFIFPTPSIPAHMDAFVSKSVQKPKPVDIPDKQKHQLNFLLPEAQTSSYRFCYETDMLNYWFLAGNLNAKETE